MKTQGLCWLAILVITMGGLGLGACEDDNPGVETESNCNDGQDDDSDGLTDCDDPDCDTATACQEQCDHNGSCDPGENAVGCPDDCATVCGDGACEGDETAGSCPEDCIQCGDSSCDTGEDRLTCPQDCAVCDDGFCDTGEDRAACPEDCAVCDDDFCDTGEDRTSCPEDCAVCDDGFCDAGEDRVTCPEDCAVCGDAICDSNEDHISCTADCIICGDTFCDAGEDISNCPVDCATVLIDEDFTTWLPTGWTGADWYQNTQASQLWAHCTNACIDQDGLLQTATFSTVGYSNVWVSFTQDYYFAGTGAFTGMYVDAPPDYYTLGQPTDAPVGTVSYDISTEAANRASVRIEFAVTCVNTSQCFLNDYWQFTDVLVWAW